MKKATLYLIPSFLSLPFLATLLIPVPIADAATPPPVAKSFLLNGNIYDGFFSNVTIKLQANNGLGYISKDGGNSAANLSLPSINPQAISNSTPLSLNWNIDDPFIKDVASCSVNIKSEDAGNSYSKSFDNGSGESGGMTFNTASLTPGSYSFILRCNLNNGRILNDLNYIYLVPTSVSIGPTPISLNISPFESDMRKYWLSIKLNENTGVVGDRKTSRQSAVNIDSLDPIAFSPSQLSSSTFSMTIYRLPVVFGFVIQSCTVNAPAAGISFGGQINPGIQESPTSTPATSSPQVIFQKSWPLIAFSGNQKLSVTCSLSNGNSIKDIIYVYGLPGAASGTVAGTSTAAVKPTAFLLASPSVIKQGELAVLSWTSTDATSCTGTGFSTGNKTNSTTSVSPASTTTYSVTCTGAGGTSAPASAKITVLPPSSNPAPSGPGCFPQIDIKVQ